MTMAAGLGIRGCMSRGAFGEDIAVDLEMEVSQCNVEINRRSSVPAFSSCQFVFAPNPAHRR